MELLFVIYFSHAHLDARLDIIMKIPAFIYGNLSAKRNFHSIMEMHRVSWEELLCEKSRHAKTRDNKGRIFHEGRELLKLSEHNVYWQGRKSISRATKNQSRGRWMRMIRPRVFDVTLRIRCERASDILIRIACNFLKVTEYYVKYIYYLVFNF